MTSELLQQLRTEVERADGLSDEAKTKLLGHVESIEQYPGDVGTARSAFKHLSSSVEALEASHPAITNIVGRLAVALGNMGI